VTDLSELERRIAHLDAGLIEAGDPARFPHPADGLTSHFIDVMQLVVDDGSAPARISPAQADALVRGCRLLMRSAEVMPQITHGPLDPRYQYWVATGKPAFLPESIRTLDRSRFTAISDTARSPRAKPSGAGLYTATGSARDHGMWRRYLEMNRGSSLHPLPWHTWQVHPCDDISVYELDSAAAWVGLVENHPIAHKGLVYPDWAAIAHEYDAVHVTLRAIAATQGMAFITEHGLSAAAYWDVESTLWLRWSFQSAQLIEAVK
jgi:hypothetical protein